MHAGRLIRTTLALTIAVALVCGPQWTTDARTAGAVFATAAVTVPPASGEPAPAAVASFAEPAISPDHAQIAFVTGGDVWIVAAGGGAARLLVATGGSASRPMFSPDGRLIAFVNSRAGATGIYTMALAGGTVARVTHDDVTPELDGWSADSRFVYFTSSAHNIVYDGDIMRVAAAGGTPMRVVSERFVNAMQAAPAPDGRTVAYVRNGFVQWWRRGHSHMDQDEIVVAGPAHRFERITNGEAKDRWPMWSPDGATLYFVSDRSGSDQLWSHAAGGLRRLTALGGESIVWPTISRDGRTIAFEHAMAIWTYDIAGATVHRVPIELSGADGVTGVTHTVAMNRFSALALAPDAKKVAFVARGRVFAASSGEDATVQQVTSAPGAAYDLPVWSKDSRRIAYVVDRGTEQAIATATLPDGAERRLTPAGRHDDYPHWSPDGTRLAFVRDGRELHVLDVATQADRIVARGFMDRRPFGDLRDIAFSPAGDWIAYVDSEKGFSNVRVVRTAGGETHAVTFLPNGNAGPVAWSTDGTRLFVVTSQRTENGQVAQVDLVPRSPRFREDAYRRLFDAPAHNELPSRTVATPVPQAAARPSPGASPTAAPSRTTRIAFAGIEQRLSFLATGLDVSSVVTTPDDKSLVLVADAAGQQNIYAYPIDDTSDEPQIAHQLTSTPGQKADVAVTADGRSLYYLDAGAIWTIGLDMMKPRRLAVAAEYDVDFSREKSLIFAQAWSLLDRWYADPNFHGADWNAVERIYAPHALGARTPDELRRIISLMLGELNSSHLGIGGPRPPGVPRYVTGRLGVQWDADAYARNGQLRIAELAPLGPLALVGGVAVGDEVVGVENEPVNRDTDIDDVLANRIGKRTLLRIAPHGDRTAARSVAVLPIDTPAEQNLWYTAWVESRRRFVERLSGGRIGYVHLLDMGEESLRTFYTDLDVQNRAKAGVVVDIRNNLGGFVDPYAVDVLTRREYVRFASRFGSDAPERTALGQRSLDLPSVLVVNEHSLSDAENFTEAYRVLRGGTVVGEPTAGWIIFTSSAGLADGSTLRLPSTRVFAHDGVDMELHPRPVDLRVDNPPGAADRGDDPQLAAAVQRLLQRSGRRSAAR